MGIVISAGLGAVQTYIYEPVTRKTVLGVSDQVQVDTNRAEQPQKMAGGLKLRIWIFSRGIVLSI